MIADLEWLQTPVDFRPRLKAVRADLAAGVPVEEALHALATMRLDVNQLGQLGGTVAAYLATEPSAGPLARVRLGVVGSGTLDLTLPALAASALRHRVLMAVVGGDYGSAVRDALDPASAVRTANLDLALIALDFRTLGLDRPQLAPGAAAAAVASAAAMLDGMIDGLAASAPGGVLVATIVPPLEPLFGSLDAAEPGSVAAQVAALNAQLAAWAMAKRIVLVDIARAAGWVGLDRWHDAGQWHAAKLPFDPDLISLYADLVARTVAAIRGTTRKCLVLDLDNTLWGGVIGDDGMAGIVLGQGSARGEAHLAVQRVALNLRARGVFLAIASKNETAIALEPFRSHPDMLLRETDISMFQANWVDKATNLEAIAKALNIGVDALVLLDDNPAERAQVRKALPTVRVAEVPEDPSWFAWTLEAGGWFEAVTFSAEDAERANMQAQDVRRAEVLAGAHDLTGYLRGLDMTASFASFDAPGRQRIVQLINKTNQFNLTTRRYTETQVRDFEADANAMTLQVRLADRFGDLGMIAVLICMPLAGPAETWNIDSWLMSCRVLGRNVEAATLSVIARKAQAMNVKRLVGAYIPTDKNMLVENHYGKLGFTQVAKDANGTTHWELDLGTYATPDLPMRLAVEAMSG